MFSRELHTNYSLSGKHLFKKSAGNAAYYYQLRFDDTLDNDLRALSRFTKENGVPFRVFGMHTNIYITDNGYGGLFVDMLPNPSSVSFDAAAETFTVSGNTPTSKLVNCAMEKGYDFAALSGVPGMVGAGIVGNAGWTPTNKNFSDFVVEIEAYDFVEDGYVTFHPDDAFFAERTSYIKQQNAATTRYLVTKAVLKAEQIGTEQVRAKWQEQMQKRDESLRNGFKDGCAGSIWSNTYLKTATGRPFPAMLREHPDLKQNFNGARYGDAGSMFFTTGADTTDKDVARLLIHTVEHLQEYYQVVPKMEMLILDRDGEIGSDTFIERNR